MLCLNQFYTYFQHKIDDGQVIFVSSLSGHRVPWNGAPHFYAATKHAVNALLEGFRQEVGWRSDKTSNFKTRAFLKTFLNLSNLTFQIRDEGPNNIRISALSPGVVETEFAEAMTGSKEKAEEFYSKIKYLAAEDLAAHVKHILELPKHVQIHDIIVRPTQQRL